ncbi:hypothetical protein [Acidithiobacillus sp.]|nr:hypothetical protein [Acidithiobacillus sp.]
MESGNRDITVINERLLKRWSYADGRPLYWLLKDRSLIIVRS